MGWFSFVLAQQRVGGKLSDSLEKNWILNESHTWHDCFLLGKIRLTVHNYDEETLNVLDIKSVL